MRFVAAARFTITAERGIGSLDNAGMSIGAWIAYGVALLLVIAGVQTWRERRWTADVVRRADVPVVPPGARAVTMPSIGYEAPAGTVVGIRKRVGDAVAAGEAVAEIDTDKVTFELPCDFAGTIVAVFVQVRDLVPAGFPLMAVRAAEDEVTGVP